MSGQQQGCGAKEMERRDETAEKDEAKAEELQGLSARCDRRLLPPTSSCFLLLPLPLLRRPKKQGALQGLPEVAQYYKQY